MVIVSVFDALSIGSDPMAAVDLCIKRGYFLFDVSDKQHNTDNTTCL